MNKWLGLALMLVAACGGDDSNNNGGGGGGGGSTCGDNNVTGTEQCDDGNTASGDGCSATCSIEGGGGSGSGSGSGSGGGNATATCAMPNTLTLTATPDGYDLGTATGDTTMSTNQVAEAACDGVMTGAGNDHVWKFTLAVKSDVVVYTDSEMTWDAAIRVMTTACDVSTEVTDLWGADDGCSDSVFAEEMEILTYIGLPAGTYYVVLDGFEAADLGAYTFTVEAWPTVCGDGSYDGTNDILETCDDGDTMGGDGCSSTCQVEEGYTCDTDVEPNVCTPDNGGGTPVAPAMGDLVINEFLARDDTSDSNCDNSTQGNADEFIELVNTSNKTLDMTGVTVSDSAQVRHTFGAKTVEPGKAIVVWGGGTPNCAGVPSTMWETASAGLGLQDSGGDTISIKLGTTDITSYAYASATLNVSLNLSPDVTGATYANHSAITGAVGAYSPGKKIDGTAF